MLTLAVTSLILVVTLATIGSIQSVRPKFRAAHSSLLAFYASALVISMLVIALEIWFFVVVVRCYGYLRAKRRSGRLLDLLLLI